jgi:hypothetical protein
LEYGRHFELSNYPVISNRTNLKKNGVTLYGKEEAITSKPLNAMYDYRIDITNGHIELKGSSLQRCYSLHR